MADGIGRIFGGNNYGVGGYIPQRKNEENVNNQNNAQAQNQPEYKQVDEQQLWNFMANNSTFSPFVKVDSVSGEYKFDEDGIRERMEEFMPRYLEYCDIIENEFGPELTPTLVDMLFNKFFGMEYSV